MARTLLFHHALGLTPGVTAFAEDLRAAGHEVSVPDLYEGRLFASVDEGVAYAEERSFEALIDAGVQVAEALPNELIYAGFSLGVLPAQRLAQQRPGARGALLYHSGVPATVFGSGWPEGVPLQAHVMADDAWGDVQDLQQLARDAGGELFLYDGSAHLFTDRSCDDHDPQAAALVMERTLRFLAGVDSGG